MNRFRIFFLQIIVVVAIFCSLTFIKFLFPSIYNDIVELYKIYFCIETDIGLIFGEI